MNTLVMNLDNLAVTEYTSQLTGISGDYEAMADGVFLVGGIRDVNAANTSAKIVSSFSFGLALTESARQRRAKYLYLHGTGGVDMTTTVTDGKANAYTYTAVQRHGRAARFVLGGGLRDNYLKFSVTNPGTEALSIDRLEFETPESTNRRM